MRPFHSILFASVITLLGCDYLPTLSNDGKSADESSVSRGLPIILAAQPVGRTSTRNISIQFSEPIVSASLVGKELSDNLPVSISPSLAGTGMWVDNSNFVYRPSEQFRRSAKYKVVLDESVLGTEIDGDKEFSFNPAICAQKC